jgi:hypothetical protein
MATQEIINIGALPNDGEGDPLRVAFAKINNNFANLFYTYTNTSSAYTTGNTSGQVIFETAANTFTMGEFYIYSADVEQSQTIQLFAQLNTAGNAVKFTGHGSTFFGNALARYDMDVVNGNVRVLCDPLTSDILFHFIASQNMWAGNPIDGLDIGLDGYVSAVMATETNIVITIEQP